MQSAPTSIDMTFNPDIHHCQSIRLQKYDYSQAGLQSMGSGLAITHLAKY
jgi:hypothetical protein